QAVQKCGQDTRDGKPAGEPSPLLANNSSASEVDARFSPDGPWVAYQSNRVSMRLRAGGSGGREKKTDQRWGWDSRALAGKSGRVVLCGARPQADRRTHDVVG